jgi:undecaprenyl-phosphate glucose phosphotransferase
MLKNRQEGLTTLHAIWVTLLVLGLFVASWEIAKKSEIITLSESISFKLYFFSVLTGLIISLRAYPKWAQVLATISWRETFDMTKHQMIRLALVLFAIIFALKDSAISRVFLSSFLIIVGITLFFVNYYFPRLICRIIFKENKIPTLFVGNLNAILKLNTWLERKTSLGIEPVGFITSEQIKASTKRIPYLGQMEDYKRILKENRVGQIIVLQGYVGKNELRDIVEEAQKQGCRFHVYNNMEEDFNHPLIVNHEGEYTFYTLIDEPLENPINRILKRTFDIAISLPIVAFLLPPLFFVVWMLQKRQAPGAVFYTQPRTGITKRTFNIIKFRTMYDLKQDEKARATQARKEDSRIYPIGALLRKTSLDEIPQFINVLLGDMSVAGPRPHLIKHDEEFSNLLKSYYTRHYVKPGITGLAQTKGYRGEISEFQLLEKRIHFDLEYINHWSFLLDVEIVLITIWQVIFPPKTAY